MKYSDGEDKVIDRLFNCVLKTYSLMKFCPKGYYCKQDEKLDINMILIMMTVPDLIPSEAIL